MVYLKFYHIPIKERSQLIKIEYKKSIRIIKLNLIGKIQLKNILMAIIAAKKVI